MRESNEKGDMEIKGKVPQASTEPGQKSQEKGSRKNRQPGGTSRGALREQGASCARKRVKLLYHMLSRRTGSRAIFKGGQKEKIPCLFKTSPRGEPARFPRKGSESKGESFYGGLALQGQPAANDMARGHSQKGKKARARGFPISEIGGELQST